LDSGFKSILRSNAGGGIVLARSNKASATSTSSETVGVDTCPFSSLETLGFDPLGFCRTKQMLQSVKRFPVIGPGDVIRKKNRKCRRVIDKNYGSSSGLQGYSR
jgi:hypothetical protein